MGAILTPDLGEEMERWPRAELEAWQLERAREVLRRAHEAEPFYRGAWRRAGIDAPSLDSLADLARYPRVRKADVVRAGRERRRAPEGPVGFSTRGTSGEPLVVWLDAEEKDAYARPAARGFRWAGLGPGQTALLLSPVWHRLASSEGHAVALLGANAAYFWGSMGSADVGSFLETLGTVAPDFVTTTAPFLLTALRTCDQEGLDPRRAFASVRSVVAVGLPLTPPFRALLSERLGAEVFERSGTQEGAALDECAEHTGPHAHEDVCYLEVVDEAGQPVPPGTRGELVVTKLSPGSLFVRYATGDIAAFLPEPCPCGRTFRRLKIYGRPESSVAVGDRRVTAYDARLCVDADPALVGRNVLLVAPDEGPADALELAIEGAPAGEAELERRLRETLGVEKARLQWLGDVKLEWGFRQVISRGGAAPRA